MVRVFQLTSPGRFLDSSKARNWSLRGQVRAACHLGWPENVNERFRGLMKFVSDSVYFQFQVCGLFFYAVASS